MAARKLSEATDLLGLFAILTKVAQQARALGWEVDLSCDASKDTDRLSFAAARAAPAQDEPSQ